MISYFYKSSGSPLKILLYCCQFKDFEVYGVSAVNDQLYEEFCNCLGTIASMIEEIDTSNIVITGDFNAALNTPFEAEVIDMRDTIGLVI